MLWVVEMKLENGYWGPTVGVKLTREGGIMELRGWRKSSPVDRFRLVKYRAEEPNQMTANQPACPTPRELRELAECWESDTATRYVSVHPSQLLALADTLERQTEALRELISACYKVQDWDGTRVGAALEVAEEALRER